MNKYGIEGLTDREILATAACHMFSAYELYQRQYKDKNASQNPEIKAGRLIPLRAAKECLKKVRNINTYLNKLK